MYQIYISSVRHTLAPQAPGELRTAHLQRRLLLPVEQLPAGPVTDQQLGNLRPLLLGGGVKGGVPEPVGDVHDEVVVSQELPHHP